MSFVVTNVAKCVALMKPLQHRDALNSRPFAQFAARVWVFLQITGSPDLPITRFF
jgi:hypothetical protein